MDVPLMSPAELLLDQVELKMLEPAGNYFYKKHHL
jgi:hypothetical protein